MMMQMVIITLDTTFTSYDNVFAVKDRFIVRIYNSDNDSYIMYMVGPNNIESVSLSDFNTYDTANDYIWWD
jgi:hypothetical protein